MSVFSKIKLSRKAAKEHKVKSAAKEADKSAQLPYKHVPTHAAIDAFSGAPSSWKTEDLSKIKEHNKRKSQMVISRTHSSLLTTSYMNVAGGPSTQTPPLLQRANSCNNHNSTWFNRDGDLYYLNESTNKKIRPPRCHSYQDSCIGRSPRATRVPSEAVSPVISSGTSTVSNSSENLEISNPNLISHRPQGTVYAKKDILEQLHTSTTRKLGEAPLYDSPPVGVRPALDAVALEGKPSKQRWSLMGKKNAAAVSI